MAKIRVKIDKVCLSQTNQKRAEWKYMETLFIMPERASPRVIEDGEFESAVRFSLWLFIGHKFDQSEMSFSNFRLFGVLMKLYYRLSILRNPNLQSDFLSDFSLVTNSTNQKWAFLNSGFSMFWWNLTIGYQYSGIRICSQIFSLTFHWSQTRPIRNELF